MINHMKARAYIVGRVGAIPSGQRHVAGVLGRIKDSDGYVAVPQPANLRPVSPVGNCLIWLGKLNNDGYGTGSFATGEQLAHRQAFKESRGTIDPVHVLHLCHQPILCSAESPLQRNEARQQ